MERVELSPTGGGLDGDSVVEVRGNFGKFSIEAFESGSEDAELVEKAGALGKENLMEDAIPGGGALPGIAAEEFRLERADGREIGKMAGMVRKGFARGDQDAREPSEEFRGDADLLTSANELATSAEGESIVESDAQHGETRLPAEDDGLEDATFFAREWSGPIGGHTSLAGGRPEMTPREDPQNHTPQAAGGLYHPSQGAGPRGDFGRFLDGQQRRPLYCGATRVQRARFPERKADWNLNRWTNISNAGRS